MLTWIISNMSTIVVSMILIVVLAAAVRKIIKDKRQGKSSCGGSCGSCPMSGSCHKETRS